MHMLQVMHSMDNHRKLISFNPIVDKAQSGWVANKSIHGAYLKICNAGKNVGTKLHSKRNYCSEVIPSLSGNSFPVDFISWNTISSKSCPHIPGAVYRSEHGHGMSHLQILLEFLFFDHDVLHARTRLKPEYDQSTTYSSVSGIFHAFENGTLYKNGILFQEEDILIVLEDTIDTANLFKHNVSLQQELQHLQNDILRFGWCSSEGITPDNTMSTSTNLVNQEKTHHRRWCMYAYAITRAGARKLSKYYDTCGKPFDVQIELLVHAGLLTMSYTKQNFLDTTNANNT